MSAAGLIALLSAGNFVIGMGAFVVLGLLPPIIEDFGLSPAGGGWVMTAYALAYMLGSPLGVALTGRVPRRTVLALGMALFLAAALLSALAPDFGTLLAARVVAALGAGLYTPVAAGVAVAASPPEARGRALAGVFLGLTLAQVVGIPLGGWLGYAFGWQAAFWAAAAAALPCLAGLLVLVPRGLPVQAAGLAALGRALGEARALLAVLYTASFLGTIYVLYTFVAVLLTGIQGYGGGMVAAFLATYGLGAVAGNMLGGRLTDRIGPGRTLALVALAQMLLMPAFAFLPLADPVLFALGFVWAASGWSFMVPQQARLVALAPDRTNVLLALNASAIYLGASAGSAAGALVVKEAGIMALGPVAGALMLPVLLHLWLSVRIAR